jgi:hypothetical protein
VVGRSKRFDHPEGECCLVTPASEVRAAVLLAELTVAEKIAFLHQHQPAVDRLGIARFPMGCEALHGIARIGEAVSTEVRTFRQDTVNARSSSPTSSRSRRWPRRSPRTCPPRSPAGSPAA